METCRWGGINKTWYNGVLERGEKVDTLTMGMIRNVMVTVEAIETSIPEISSFDCVVCTTASNTPYGISFIKDDVTITGTLNASVLCKGKIYLVHDINDTGDCYDEYVVAKTPDDSYVWEKLGGVNINNIVAQKLGHKLTFGSHGEYQFDGSEDVTVPTYNGDYIID